MSSQAPRQATADDTLVTLDQVMAQLCHLEENSNKNCRSVLCLIFLATLAIVAWSPMVPVLFDRLFL